MHRARLFTYKAVEFSSRIDLVTFRNGCIIILKIRRHLICTRVSFSWRYLQRLLFLRKPNAARRVSNLDLACSCAHTMDNQYYIYMYIMYNHVYDDRTAVTWCTRGKKKNKKKNEPQSFIQSGVNKRFSVSVVLWILPRRISIEKMCMILNDWLYATLSRCPSVGRILFRTPFRLTLAVISYMNIVVCIWLYDVKNSVEKNYKWFCIFTKS